MRVFISYDLHDIPQEKRDDLLDYLDRIGAVIASESFYIIKDTNKSLESIVNEIVDVTDSDATIIVGEINGGLQCNKPQNFDLWKK